jgi:hypothetical protein
VLKRKGENSGRISHLLSGIAISQINFFLNKSLVYFDARTGFVVNILMIHETNRWLQL